MIELKPCPFCGRPDVRVASVKHKLGPFLYFGMCMVCGSKGPSRPKATDAVSVWNRRAEVKGDD